MNKNFCFLLIFIFSVSIVACRKTVSHKAIADKFVPSYKLNRFEAEIKNYEKVDAEIGLDKLQDKTLFYGSSSFRLWKTMKEDFAPISLINHGFGGSTFPEMTHYVERMVFPYRPKKLVIYCENDLFMGGNKTPEQVYDAFAELATLIQNRLPKTHIYYISMKPSSLRKADWSKVLKADELIKQYINKHKKCSYIDIRPVMFRSNGSVNGDYFVGDSLHMNAKGYAEWTKIIKPILMKTI